MKDTKNVIIGIFMAVLGGSLWGFSGVCGQYLIERQGLTPSFIVPYRLLFSGFAMLIFYFIKDFHSTIKILKNLRAVKDLIIYSLFGIMLCQYTYFVTIYYSNAATATVLQYLAPVVILIIVCVSNKKKPLISELIAIIFGFSGVYLIATHGNLTSLAISPKALIVGLLSMFTVVVYNLAPKYLLKHFPAPLVIAWAMSIGGVILSLFLRPWEYDVKLNLMLVLAFSSVILFGTISAFTMYMVGVKYIGPVKASLYASVEPVMATVLSALLLDTEFHFFDIIGFILIISTGFVLAVPNFYKSEINKKEGM